MENYHNGRRIWSMASFCTRIYDTVNMTEIQIHTNPSNFSLLLYSILEWKYYVLSLHKSIWKQKIATYGLWSLNPYFFSNNLFGGINVSFFMLLNMLGNPCTLYTNLTMKQESRFALLYVTFLFNQYHLCKHTLCTYSMYESYLEVFV